MNSIRIRILLWVFLLFILIWLGTTYATFQESSHEVEELFDSELAQVAGVLSQISATQKLLYSDIDPKLKKEIYGHRYEKKIAFQIWENDRLILQSANAPPTVLSETLGYSDQIISDKKWRVFGLAIPELHQSIFTAESYDIRNELIFEITQQSLFPLTLMIPVLLLIVWIGIGRGLSPVRKLTRQLSKRSPGNLEPVEADFNLPVEIKPLINSLNSLFQKLRNAFEREKRFTSDAAHELQTPLASIKAQAQVALRAKDKDEQQHALQQVSEGINRATHMVHQLLALARLDPQSNSYTMQSVELGELARHIISMLDEDAHKKHIELTLTAEQTYQISGNQAALQMLIGNIVSNAIRYSPENSCVDVIIMQQKEQVELCVLDMGPGISDEEKERVFERFYRGENNQHIVGSGLGLSIVQRIAQLHQAELSMQNRKGVQGLRFCVRFKV